MDDLEEQRKLISKDLIMKKNLRLSYMKKCSGFFVVCVVNTVCNLEKCESGDSSERQELE